jgi:zinc D-Ala-D-Ala carboxypeptidase
MISMQELNPNNYDTTDEQAANLATLLDRMNQVRTLYNIPMIVTSGLRSEADQQRINPSAPKSKHLLGCAADVQDKDGSLREWVLSNLAKMKEIGLWFEDFRYTDGWVHFQILPPLSGHIIFVPTSGPIPHPELWDGVYDHQFDSEA